MQLTDNVANTNPSQANFTFASTTPWSIELLEEQVEHYFRSTANRIQQFHRVMDHPFLISTKKKKVISVMPRHALVSNVRIYKLKSTYSIRICFACSLRREMSYCFAKL
jgi:hypothetical protein